MVIINGTLLKSAQATLAINNRGLNYGDAVFETMRFAKGSIYFLEDHYLRLRSSMDVLRMEIPKRFSKSFLEKEVVRLLEKAGDPSKSYRIKLLVWRKAGGKYTPYFRGVDYCISFEELSSAFYVLNDSPYEIDVFEDHVVASGSLSTLKSTNRIVNVLAGIYAEENKYDNCLLLNEKAHLIEALNGNLFLVKGKKVTTPPLSDGCINGTMRKQLLKILAAIEGFSLNESSIIPSELENADEVIITNSIKGVVSVTKYRDRQFGDSLAGELVTQLNHRVQAEIN